jgi:hypothetical protein
VAVATGARLAASSGPRARTGNGTTTRTRPLSHLISQCLPHIWWTLYCHPQALDSTITRDIDQATTGNAMARAMPPRKTWLARPGLISVGYHCQP